MVVGCWVGSLVGFEDGPLEGFVVGKEVGWMEGILEGAFVGFVDGNVGLVLG